MKANYTIKNFAKRVVMALVAILMVGNAWSADFFLVKDASSLTVGDHIIIVNADNDYAISTTQNTNNRAATSVSASNEKITPSASVEVLTLGAGTTESSYWTLYTTGSKYLYAAASNANRLKSQNNVDVNAEWDITIDASGNATIIAEGSSNRNEMNYNYNNGSPIFNCYSSGGTLHIYKQGSSTYTVTVNKNQASWGTVSASSVGSIASGTSISASSNVLTVGATSVTATPHAQDADYNYAFSSWSGIPVGGTVTADVTVTANFTRTARTYKNYRTVCCANMVDAPTVSATDIHAHQFTLTWTNVTGADGYTVTCAGGTPGAVQSSSTTRTCTITGLASANTAYSWSVVATYSGSYCGATPANGSTTTAQEYSVSYNANGGTVTTLPASANYEAGVTVTVAAKPATTTKSGYTFTGWNTANDGSGTHYDATGSATFTMPSSAVVLYAEWTTKKNYYVDRMHGTNDGHTVTIGGVVYNCYLREAAYTVPTISDNTSGATTCHNEHDHLLFWVTASSVNDDGTLKNSYTEVTPGSAKTATTDGTIYYAIWGKLAD